jgi:RNA polymerase sigma factor (sigma-70 family)
MTENEFARSINSLMFFLARRVAQYDHEDLAQIGAIAALKLFRKRGGDMPKTSTLVALAARRAMCQSLRNQYTQKRTGEVCPIHDEITAAGARPEAPEAVANRRIDLERAIEQLPPVERAVIEKTLAGETLEQIGRPYGVTFARIGLIKLRAIARMRKFLTAA